MRNGEVRRGLRVVFEEKEYYVKENIPRECLRVKRKKDREKSNRWILVDGEKEIGAECTSFNPVIEERGGIKFYMTLAKTERSRLNKKTSVKTKNMTLSDF